MILESVVAWRRVARWLMRSDTGVCAAAGEKMMTQACIDLIVHDVGRPWHVGTPQTSSSSDGISRPCRRGG